MNTDKITRLEVIGEWGREYTGRNKRIELSVQDNGQTLKIFVKNRNKKSKSVAIPSSEIGIDPNDYDMYV